MQNRGKGEKEFLIQAPDLKLLLKRAERADNAGQEGGGGVRRIARY